LTYPGAFHHATNRGHNGEAILADALHKSMFLDLLREKVQRYRIRLLAFCLMDNHYHLVIQNTSGRMSDFFRNLNTQYAFYYRRVKGGKGYVFQSRYHSTLIQDESYLLTALLYTLQNPLRAGIVDNCLSYRWSSARFYFDDDGDPCLDHAFVRRLLGDKTAFLERLNGRLLPPMPLLRTALGPVLGANDFLPEAVNRFERRNTPGAVQHRRHDDFGFDPVEKVIWEFERRHSVTADNLDTHTLAGKRLRGELLVQLRDWAGMTFREISELLPFSDLQYKTLMPMYQRAKKLLNSKSAIKV